MDIGTRMKTFYEEIAKTKLTKRTPVAIRIDGKAFHTFTKGFNKPFDHTLMTAMQATMKYLCENIQGCVLGYTQSDEITFILIDYQKLNSSAWFDYEVQKLCSISASMATMAFNKYFKEIATTKYERDKNFWAHDDKWLAYSEKLYRTHHAVFDKAMFDAHCFNIPKEEVTNLIYWRQLDATRNSIESVAHHYFKQSELQYKSCNDIQNMLLIQKDINWNNYSIPEKRGACCIKNKKGKWLLDLEIPIFKDENREYIERFLYSSEQ